jgi:hypothetical protein
MGRHSNMPEEYKGRKKYSFSALTSWEECTWGYYLQRLLKVDSKDNFYNLMGAVVHDDCLDSYKNGKITKQEMFEVFKDGFNTIVSEGYRLDSDDGKNEEQLNSYYNCIKHYLLNYYEVDNIDHEENEAEMWTELKGNVFIGYIDHYFSTTEGIHYIRDYKTSSMYAPAKRFHYGRQLILYTKYLLDKGIKYKDIRIMWDFAKYAKLSFKKPRIFKIDIQNDSMLDQLIENGLVKTRRSTKVDILGYEDKTMYPKRDEIGNKLRASLRAMLKFDGYTEEEIESIVKKTSSTNDLKHVPKQIINKYQITIERADVELEFNKKVFKEMENSLLGIIEEIEDSQKINEDRPEDEHYKVYERDKIERFSSFFCIKLCGVNHSCKYFKEFMGEENMMLMDEHKTGADDLRGGEDFNLDDIDLDDLLDSDDIDLDTEDDLEIPPEAKDIKVEKSQEEIDLDNLLDDL